MLLGPSLLHSMGAGSGRSLDDPQIVRRWQRWKLRRRDRLIPVRNRRDIILERKELRTAARIAGPSKRLDRDPQILSKPDRIRDMPSVHPESLLRRVEPVGPNYLRKPRIRGRELAVAAVFLADVEVIRAAEIILGAGAANGGKLAVAVDKKLYLALAPPSAVMHAPRDIGAHVLPAPSDAVED